MYSMVTIFIIPYCILAKRLDLKCSRARTHTHTHTHTKKKDKITMLGDVISCD